MKNHRPWDKKLLHLPFSKKNNYKIKLETLRRCWIRKHSKSSSSNLNLKDIEPKSKTMKKKKDFWRDRFKKWSIEVTQCSSKKKQGEKYYKENTMITKL